jgi:ABC-2 type transport system ATP-binding protein
MREVGALLDAQAVHGDRRAYHHLLCLTRSNGIPSWRVDEVLQLVGLERVAGQRVHSFSRGMLQRLRIAAALLGDPAVVILDEPVKGLDPEGMRWIRDLSRHLAHEGRTVLVSSHLMHEVARTADHLVVIGRGRLLADTGVQALLESMAPATVLVRTDQTEVLARRLRGCGATVQVGADHALVVTGMDSADICRFAAAGQVVLSELTPQRVSLEDMFMELTRDSTEFRVTEGAA